MNERGAFIVTGGSSGIGQAVLDSFSNRFLIRTFSILISIMKQSA